MNGYLYDINDGSSNPSNFNGGDTPSDKGYWWGSNISQVKSPTDVPFTADSLWMVGWPEDTDTPPVDGTGDNNVTGPGGGGSGNNTFTRFLFDRHPGTTSNVSFVDGHSESITASGLYEQKWGPMYDTTIGKTTGATINWPD